MGNGDDKILGLFNSDALPITDNVISIIYDLLYFLRSCYWSHFFTLESNFTLQQHASAEGYSRYWQMDSIPNYAISLDARVDMTRPHESQMLCVIPEWQILIAKGKFAFQVSGCKVGIGAVCLKWHS